MAKRALATIVERGNSGSTPELLSLASSNRVRRRVRPGPWARDVMMFCGAMPQSISSEALLEVAGLFFVDYPRLERKIAQALFLYGDV